MMRIRNSMKRRPTFALARLARAAAVLPRFSKL
jgi:hypothetical protein